MEGKHKTKNQTYEILEQRYLISCGIQTHILLLLLYIINMINLLSSLKHAPSLFKVSLKFKKVLTNWLLETLLNIHTEYNDIEAIAQNLPLQKLNKNFSENSN